MLPTSSLSGELHTLHNNSFNHFLCILVFSRENMYQDHLHKITDDSEKQRMKRDQLIESLKKNMSTTDAELKKTRLKQETDRYMSLFRNNHSLSCASFFCYLMYVRFKRHIYQLVLLPKKRMCRDSLALYSLASVCIFSILLPRHFLGFCQGEFVQQSRVGDHLLYSHDLNVWFRGDVVRRN